MIYIGIDPGLSGGIATIAEGGAYVHAIPMPPTERDIWEAINYGTWWLDPEMEEPKDGPERCAMIELAQAHEKQGIVSTGKTMANYGALRMALIGSGIPFERITPFKWQNSLGIPKRGFKTKPQHKNVLKARSQELFSGRMPPHIKKITLAIADALLIAEHLRRIKEGELTR